MNDKNSFNYTYSSEEHKEILDIQNKYAGNKAKEPTIDELRRLDKSAARPGTIVGIIVGIIGTLTLGTGMSMIMAMGSELFILGIIIGVIGMIIAFLAFPIYKAVTKKQKKRIAPRILELSEKLLNEQK